MEGFSVAAEFEKKICEYINIVYPKADLKENPFVADLYGRVVRSVLSREGAEKTILEEDVPEYNKNDFLPDMNYEAKVDAEASIHSDKKVAILLVPSTFNSKNKDTYEYSRIGEKDAKKYNGIQTNDAPLQYLMDTVCKNGEKLEKVILLPSKEVMYKDVPELQSHTAYGRLCKLIHRYHSILLGHDESEDELDVKAIAIDYAKEQENGNNHPEKQVYKTIEETSEVVITKSPRERLPQMFDELAKELSGCSKVYIDFTGGQRDMNFLMVAIIKFLQTTGLSCGEIIYSNINGKQRFLMDMDIQYQMFQLINATNEFLNTGSAKLLDDFFKPLDTACVEDTDTASNPVKEIVGLMKKYSEMINVCNLDKLDDTVRKLVEKIDEFSKNKSDNLYSQMFQSILPIIKERLYLDHVIDEKDNKKVVNYPYIIKWCLDNDMLQQALTLYVERMPKYYFDKSIYENRVYDGVGKADPSVEIKFGPNIVDWPTMSALTDNLLLKVVSVIHDPVTTTDELIPSGETSSYRSNPLGLAEFTLSRKDPEYVGRAKEIQKAEKARIANESPIDAVNELGSVFTSIREVFTDVNYKNTGIGSTIYAVKPGDGSAREQAASCQKVLGGWANIAKEYATKRYRSNLINWGMLPFILKEDICFDNGDYLFVPNIIEAIKEKKDSIKAYVVNKSMKELELKLGELTDDEREIILKGCLINYYKLNS